MARDVGTGCDRAIAWVLCGLLALLLAVACDAGPQAGAPGLEPPHGTDDAGTLTPSTDDGKGATDTPTSPAPTDAAGAGGGSAGGAGSAGNAGSAPASAMSPGVVTTPFSVRYATQITQDCQLSVQCRLQRDEALENDALEQCVADSAAQLDQRADVQAAFLASVGRCSQLVACDYYDCATSGPGTYGESQKDKVEYACKAESDCRAAMGSPDTDVAYATSSCAAFNAGKLDSLTSEQRAAYELAYADCATLTACAFADCFGF